MADLDFIFLDDNSIEYLENDDGARMAYIDLLSLLHDLLSPLGTEPERPRFETAEVLNDLAHQIHAFGSGREIGQIARANVAVAKNFHEFIGVEPDSDQAKALRPAVDAFVADLLKQYDLIRVIRSRQNREPQPA